ncbi:hypothetical protein P8452_10418 [Trifolium repens]|nr:hypothetical protein P8452_10418 [Trifolium repens]
MPSLFSKQLYLCFFKLKYPTIISQSHPQHTTTPSPSQSPPYTFHHFNTTFTHHHHHDEAEDYFFDDTTELPPPDFASAFASQRFFFSSPGSSKSITEIESPLNNTQPCKSLIPKGGSVKRVPKYSVNPYDDFLCSMQEMIQSQQQAFTHLLVDILSSSSSSSFSSSSQPPSPPSRKLNSQRRPHSFSRRLL